MSGSSHSFYFLVCSGFVLFCFMMIQDEHRYGCREIYLYVKWKIYIYILLKKWQGTVCRAYIIVKSNIQAPTTKWSAKNSNIYSTFSKWNDKLWNTDRWWAANNFWAAQTLCVWPSISWLKIECIESNWVECINFGELNSTRRLKMLGLYAVRVECKTNGCISYLTLKLAMYICFFWPLWLMLRWHIYPYCNYYIKFDINKFVSKESVRIKSQIGSFIRITNSRHALTFMVYVKVSIIYKSISHYFCIVLSFCFCLKEWTAPTTWWYMVRRFYSRGLNLIT